ncbi:MULTISPECIES: FG-GAP repeat domain-containing protein [Pseudooceanicola]|uniref:FG-GAP repeat domain-containing protein n=1 Tax=Pseudooceanicola TaxID=1679449 RepID=UPI0028801D84|nr:MULTISPECIES: VCBS repeat-containing protein [Pseudooceanicola]
MSAEPRIEAARLILPTGRYPHGVLGDRIEHGGMALQLSDGRQLRMILPESLVFEDTAPRLADLDGDGAPEVLVVESSLSRGARLAVWDAQGRRSATAFIGQPWRWLAPLGAADLDGDGRIEIAYVDRPHLVKTLRLLRYEDGALTPLASAPDVSNHRIGWTEIAGGLRLCPGTPPEMILADGDWHQVLALRLTPQGAILRRVLGPYAGLDSLASAQRCD